MQLQVDRFCNVLWLAWNIDLQTTRCSDLILDCMWRVRHFSINKAFPTINAQTQPQPWMPLRTVRRVMRHCKVDLLPNSSLPTSALISSNTKLLPKLYHFNEPEVYDWFVNFVFDRNSSRILSPSPKVCVPAVQIVLCTCAPRHKTRVLFTASSKLKGSHCFPISDC